MITANDLVLQSFATWQVLGLLESASSDDFPHHLNLLKCGKQFKKFIAKTFLMNRVNKVKVSITFFGDILLFMGDEVVKVLTPIKLTMFS